MLATACETPIPLYPDAGRNAPIVTVPSTVSKPAPTPPAAARPAAPPPDDASGAVAIPVPPPGIVVAPAATPSPGASVATPGVLTLDRVAPGLPAGPIVVVLPLRSPDFSRAAEAVRSGVLAARDALAPAREIRVVETDASRTNVVDAYREAVRSGAIAIIGPLTRTEVQAIATDAQVAVPTIALNTVEGPVPPRMTPLALNIESEAMQIARVAYDDARARDVSAMPTAVVASTNASLYKRAAQAFVDGFLQAGGRVIETFDVPLDAAPAVPPRLKSAAPSVVFAALPATQAGALHAAWRDVPMVGTSSLAALDARVTLLDLEGVRIVDAPWLVTRNDPVLVRFARPESAQRWSPDLERLYALGIDAFRVALELARGNARFELDGATGHLTVVGSHVERRAALATIRDGEVVAGTP